MEQGQNERLILKKMENRIHEQRLRNLEEVGGFTPKPEFEYFKAWVCERMNIFWKRENGEPKPWTEDKLLSVYKFTNVYRILDRVSQYFIENVISTKYNKKSMLKRVLLFKHFNKIETWELLIDHFGDIDENTKLQDVALFLDEQSKDGVTVYSSAYMTTSNILTGIKGYEYMWGIKSKLRCHLACIEQEIFHNEQNLEIIFNAKTLDPIIETLLTIRGTGGFTAYQYAQDISYCPQFNVFIGSSFRIGPGTKHGIERCFDVDIKSETSISILLEYVKLELYNLEDTGDFKTLPDYDFSVADICACFYETDKYLRGSGIVSRKKSGTLITGVKIKQVYKDRGFKKGSYSIPMTKSGDFKPLKRIIHFERHLGKKLSPNIKLALMNILIQDPTRFHEATSELEFATEPDVTSVIGLFNWNKSREGYSYWYHLSGTI